MNFRLTTMKKQLITYISLIFIISLSSCSSFYGGSTNSTGDMDISAVPTEIQVAGDVNTTSYRTITFSNKTESNYEIHNMAFVDNDCGAYSVYNVLDSANNMLYQTGDDIDVSVVSGATININIQFSPLSCDTTEYTTYFIVYYMVGSEEKSETVALVTNVNDTAPTEITCEEDTNVYYDEYENPTERTLPALSAGEYYYLRVDKLSAYIQTTGAFAAYASQVSTHLHLDVIPEDERFEPVYIPFTTDENGVVTVTPIDECIGFTMPTPITDTFFIGAPVTVTTATEFSGTIDREETPGRFSIPNAILRMSSYINNSNSLLQSTDGYFDVNIQIANLTTGTTDSNAFIVDVPEDTDDEGDPLLNVVDDTLVGKDIRHGTISLVGIGTFLDDENTQLSNEAKSGIIDNEAYLFIQMEGVVTQRWEQ